jgi:hypothetical protein
MKITQAEPIDGIESAELELPIPNNYATGHYSFSVDSDSMSQPRFISTSCHHVPQFAIRVDVSVPTGELYVTLGKADTSEPLHQRFLLPRYIRQVPAHVFRIYFRNWEFIEAQMDESPLVRAPEPTEMFFIEKDVETLISACDLLRSHSSAVFVLPSQLDQLDGQFIFLLQALNFEFSLRVENGECVLSVDRNHVANGIVIDSEKPSRCLTISHSHKRQRASGKR